MIDKLRISKILVMMFNSVYGIMATIGLGTGLHFMIKYKKLEQELFYYSIYFPIEEALYMSLLVVSTIAILLVILNTYVFKRNNSRLEKCVICFILFYCVMKLFFGYAAIKKDVYPNNHKVLVHQIFDQRHRDTIQPYLEEEYNCCGCDGPLDYHRFTTTKYPESCYRNSSNTNKLKEKSCDIRIERLDTMRYTRTYLTFLYECCGFTEPLNYSDFKSVRYPDTCYHELSGIKKLKEDGCAEKIRNQYLMQIKGVFLVFVVSGTLEILGYMITAALLDTIRISHNTPINV